MLPGDLGPGLQPCTPGMCLVPWRSSVGTVGQSLHYGVGVSHAVHESRVGRRWCSWWGQWGTRHRAGRGELPSSQGLAGEGSMGSMDLGSGSPYEGIWQGWVPSCEPWTGLPAGVTTARLSTRSH